MEKQEKKLKDQKLNITLEASRGASDEKSKLKLEIDSACDMEFAINVFNQLFKQDETLEQAAQLAMLARMSGSTDLTKLMSESSPIVEQSNN